MEKYTILEKCKKELQKNFNFVYQKLIKDFEELHKDFITEFNSISYDIGGLDNKLYEIRRNNIETVRSLEHRECKNSELLSDLTIKYSSGEYMNDDILFRKSKIKKAEAEKISIEKERAEFDNKFGIPELNSKIKELREKAKALCENSDGNFKMDYRNHGNISYVINLTKIPNLNLYTDFEKFFRNVEFEIMNLSESETLTHLVVKYKIDVHNPELFLK